MEELNQLSRQGTEKAQELYEKGRQTAQQSMRRAQELAETAREKSRVALDRSKQAMHTTDEWVHENPWVTVGLIAGIGLLLGLLIGQSRRDYSDYSDNRPI